MTWFIMSYNDQTQFHINLQIKVLLDITSLDHECIISSGSAKS